jgi:hypothetical protein
MPILPARAANFKRRPDTRLPDFLGYCDLLDLDPAEAAVSAADHAKVHLGELADRLWALRGRGGRR